MSDTADMSRLEQDDVNLTQSPADNIDWSQFHDMFMNIEQRLPNFDHMLMAMNDYAFHRTSRQRQTNDLIEFCGLIKKGLTDWYTSSINNKMNRVPDFIDLTNQVFGDDTLMNVDKKLVSSTSPKTDANKIKDTSAYADASKSTSTSANADASISTHTIANTDVSESTITIVNTDANESTNTSANNTDAKESTNTSGNTDASESTNIGATADVIKSTATSPGIDILDAVTKLTDRMLSEESDINKRNRSRFISGKNLKNYYRHLDSASALEILPQSIETNVDTDESFKIIMPHMTEYNTNLRKNLPIDCNIHLGKDYERHWWRQTNDKINLYVDVSDLLDELNPNIKVEVTIIGFKVKVRRSNKWIVILSNKFQKPIRKTKWVFNKYRHVKLTINKKEKEFWSKCLVTETRELDVSNFKNHSCSNECNTPKSHNNILNLNKTKKERMEELKNLFKEEYDYGDTDTFMKELNATVPITTEKPEDSSLTLNLSADTSTAKSMKSDSENPPCTKQFSMDSEVPPTLAESKH